MAKIYYWTKAAMDDLQPVLYGSGNELPTQEDFEKYYVTLPIELEETNPEAIFKKLNTEGNPLETKELQNWIRQHNTHTSMSVGDIVEIGGDFYLAKNEGFEQIHLRERG